MNVMEEKGITTLDLHGEKHEFVHDIVLDFVFRYQSKIPLIIICGNSNKMINLVLDCLKKNVPGEVPGIAFLSGGQSEIESSKNLNEINKINDTNFLITCSYGRGLQASALKEFGKNQENTENIQKAFNHRAKMNGLSSKGEWSEELEKEFAA